MFNIKKIISLISLVVAIPVTISTAQAEYDVEFGGSYNCDKVSHGKLRWEPTKKTYFYTFENQVYNNSEAHKIYGYRFIFDEQGDFNDEENPDFKPTSWIMNKSTVVKKGDKGVWLKATKEYPIINKPLVRKKNNLKTIYEMQYLNKTNGYKNGNWITKSSIDNLQKHYTCKYYEVTWCGDGIVDNYKDASGEQISETCDPQDPNKLNWGNNGCSLSCKPIN